MWCAEEKLCSQKKTLGRVRQKMLRLLHRGAISAMAVALLSGFAMAQTKPAVPAFGGAFAGPFIQKAGFPLAPLSRQQMSTETAQGLPSGNPALSPQSQGNNSVLLWDEVSPSKAAAPSAVAGGTLTLNIVN